MCKREIKREREGGQNGESLSLKNILIQPEAIRPHTFIHTHTHTCTERCSSRLRILDFLLLHTDTHTCASETRRILCGILGILLLHMDNSAPEMLLSSTGTCTERCGSYFVYVPCASGTHVPGKYPSLSQTCVPSDTALSCACICIWYLHFHSVKMTFASPNSSELPVGLFFRSLLIEMGLFLMV